MTKAAPENTGGYSPLVASYGAWASGRPVAPVLPRELLDFLGAFGPMKPLYPFPVDTPTDGAPRPEPRRSQYPVGWNLPTGVPGAEGLKLASFAMLRAYADSYSVARACVNVRKQEILGLGYDIVPTEAAEKAMRNDRAMHADFAERRMGALAFFKRPDSNYRNFHSWLSAVLEDVLVVDALSLYLHPTRLQGKGPFGSDIAELSLIAGDTIKPLLTVRGTRPRPPNPAYQQFLYGVPRTELMSPILEDDELGDPAATYRGDQLMYLPYTTRSWTPYGFSPVEMSIVPVLTGLKRQQWVLDWFTEGTIPGMFVMPPAEINNPQQIRVLQDMLNAYAGDRAQSHRIVVLPGGSTAQAQKAPELADRADEIIYQNVCMPFDVMPMELGISPKVSNTQSPGAANQMAKASENINKRKTLKPLLRWLNLSVFDFILQELWGQKDMRWTWEGLDPVSDEEATAKLASTRIFSAQSSIDEERMAVGKPPWGLPETSGPMIVNGASITFLEDAITRQQQGTLAMQQALDQGGGDQGGDAEEGDGDGTPAHAGPDPNDQENRATSKAKLDELNALRSYTRHGRDPWKFKPRVISKSMLRQVIEDSGEYGMPSAIQRAMQTVKKDATSARTKQRDATVDSIAASVATQLGTLARQVQQDKLSTLSFVDQATATMQAGYSDAYSAGAETYDSEYDIDEADESAIEARAQAQHGFLQSLAADIAAGLSAADLGARLAAYGASVNGAWEEGYGAAVKDGQPEAKLIWHTTVDESTCDLCLDRDGQEYTFESLPGWPGDGGYGDLCSGGPNCRCEIEYDEG